MVTGWKASFSVRFLLDTLKFKILFKEYKQGVHDGKSSRILSFQSYF